MFFRAPDNKCEDSVALRKIIADEKCRKSKAATYGINANYDTYLWSQKECADASQKLVAQVEECLRAKQNKP